MFGCFCVSFGFCVTLRKLCCDWFYWSPLSLWLLLLFGACDPSCWSWSFHTLVPFHVLLLLFLWIPGRLLRIVGLVASKTAWSVFLYISLVPLKNLLRPIFLVMSVAVCIISRDISCMLVLMFVMNVTSSVIIAITVSSVHWGNFLHL